MKTENSSPSICLLDALPLGERAWVLGVTAPPDRVEWQRQLQDLGFEPGEPVGVLSRTRPGGDPLVVRVAGSTYALRRAEARCIQVERKTQTQVQKKAQGI